MRLDLVNESDFVKHYWKYFISLKKCFLETENFVFIDKENFKTFSLEYDKIFQSICSEIDVILKTICKIFDANSNADKMNKYKSVLNKYLPKINEEKVLIGNTNVTLKPFENWTKNLAPEWWTCYNKVKHERTTTCTKTNSPFYKKQYFKAANLENTLNALSALYILEFYCLLLVEKKSKKNYFSLTSV
ncbi:MAG: hypothetical protein PHX27_04435, partial [Candidatus ainarchaeum sp.]|nr:hypothetical protein [Candidatus ainarchaeum sp.]